jgi:acetolactate synthase-1/2/3 large subunit
VEPTFFVHATGKNFLRSVLQHFKEDGNLGDRQEQMARWLKRMKRSQKEYPILMPNFKAETVTSISEDNGEEVKLCRTPMSAQSAVSMLDTKILEAGIMDDCLFSTGVGIHQMVAAQLITWTQPRQMLSSGSLGTMGVALGYAVGAQLANGSKMVIAIDGDGSFNMTFTELKTVAEQGIPVKIMILDNESQMMVEYWQRLFHEGRFLAVRNQQNPDYVKLAGAFGIKALYCDAQEDLEGKMKEFLFDDPGKPVLFHVRIERTPCLPLVAPGQPLQNMILEDIDCEMDASAAPS